MPCVFKFFQLMQFALCACCVSDYILPPSLLVGVCILTGWGWDGVNFLGDCRFTAPYGYYSPGPLIGHNTLSRLNPTAEAGC